MRATGLALAVRLLLLLAAWAEAAGGVARRPAVLVPASAADASALLDVLAPGGAGGEQRGGGSAPTFVLFTSSSPRCGACREASTHFQEVAVEVARSGEDVHFVALDEQRELTRQLFAAAGATLGPSVLYVPPRQEGIAAGRRWFHNEQPDKVRGGIDYVRLTEWIRACTGKRDEHPTSWIRPLDPAYDNSPRRWLQRVVLMTSRLRGHPQPGKLPDTVRMGMMQYISALHANKIAVHTGSSMPFRPNPDHTQGDPLADFLHALSLQDDVRMVLESGTGLGGSARAIAGGLQKAPGAGKWLFTIEVGLRKLTSLTGMLRLKHHEACRSLLTLMCTPQAVREMWAWSAVSLAWEGLPAT